MALSLVSVPTNVTNFSVRSGAKFLLQRSRFSPQRHVTRYFAIRAVQESEGPRRLVDIIRIIPDISRNYFRSRSRRALFGGISLLGGFYVAQTISLSFGALGVNDVIAAVVCVLLTEYVTRFYYSRPKVTFPIALLNNFKMGFTYGLFIDAFKLASWEQIAVNQAITILEWYAFFNDLKWAFWISSDYRAYHSLHHLFLDWFCSSSKQGCPL